MNDFLITFPSRFSFSETRFCNVSLPDEAFSRVKVCPRCLKKWVIIQKKGSAEAFAIEGQPCSWCSIASPYVVPGSLLDDMTSQTVDWGLIEYLPVELLQREFDLHIKGIDSHDSSSPADFDTATATVKCYYPGIEPLSGG